MKLLRLLPTLLCGLLFICVANADLGVGQPVQLNGNGQLVLPAPASGTTFTLTGISGSFTETLIGGSGSSFGLVVEAGTGATDISFLAENRATSATFLEIFGDGHGTLGPSATSGLSWNTSGVVTASSGLVSAGTTFTLGSGTGACATSSTLVGGAIAGSFLCTGTAGAATQVVNLPTSPNGWSCWASDETAGTNLAQSAHATNSVTLKGTIAVTSDRVVFGCVGY